MSVVAASLERALAVARSKHRVKAELDALDRYPWPAGLRAAAYITWVGAMLSICVKAGPQPVVVVVSVGLGLIFLKGLVTISEAQRLTTQSRRIAILVVQCAIAIVLMGMTFCIGSELLLYLIAAELQFVVSFRSAIIGTILLLIVQDVMIVLVGGAETVAAGGTVEALLTSPAGYAFVAAFTRSAVSQLVQRYRAEALLDELNEAHEQLQAYADQVDGLATARERNRMAREIHDTLGHYLTVINVQLETAQKLRERDPARSAEALDTAKQLASESLNEVRRSVAALRPAALEDAGLDEAVRMLVRGLQGSSGLSIHLGSQGHGELPADVEVSVYRSIQEALTNVRKHARATNVWLDLIWEDDGLTVTVRDDGGGSGGDTGGGGFGLRSMRERLERAGGTLSVDPSPSGFSLTMHAPVRRELESSVP